MDVHPLPPLLHNQPQLIAGEVEALAGELRGRYDRVAIGYADCGTYGALDEVCERLGLHRLPGLHCYDVYGGAERIEALSRRPARHLPADRLPRPLVRAHRACASSAWTATPSCATTTSATTRGSCGWRRSPTPSCARWPQTAAERIGLPLTVVATGHAGLERALADLVA